MSDTVLVLNVAIIAMAALAVGFLGAAIWELRKAERALDKLAALRARSLGQEKSVTG